MQYCTQWHKTMNLLKTSASMLYQAAEKEKYCKTQNFHVTGHISTIGYTNTVPFTLDVLKNTGKCTN